MSNQTLVNQLIFYVEQADAAGASPFRLVESIQKQGFSRLEAIEIYRIGANAWSLEPEADCADAL